MKVIMVGGGTGGHIYPAIAIAEAIQDKKINSQILFIGSEDGIETKIVPQERFSLVTIKSRGMLRKLSYKAISSPFFAIAGFFQAIGIIKNFMPDVIIATGGFVSFPVVCAAFILRKPVMLYEGNVTPGLTARICKWLSTRIVVAFEQSRRYYRWRKVFAVGGPVRREVLKAVKGISIQNLNLRQDKKIVLILGGSQGARSINKVIVESLQELEKLNIQLIHVCGERDFEWIKKETAAIDNSFYRLIPYMQNIWDGLAAADLVISRAGATVISEILARGVPSILIPFPFSAGKHQDINAETLQKEGAAVVIKDSRLNKDDLISEIRSILNSRETTQKIIDACKKLSKPNAANDIVNIIFNMLGMDLYARKRKTKK